MKVVLCHTDFSLYWLPRILALKKLCVAHDTELQIIEIAGKGSPYEFARVNHRNIANLSWLCLYPDDAMEHLNPSGVSRRLFSELDRINPDIIFAGAIAYPSGATAVRWARKRKRAIVIMDDARRKDVPRSRLVNWVKRRIYANVDALFIPAASHVSDYRYWGIPEERMFFGVNVVDNYFFTDRSALARQNAASIREKYVLPNHFFLGVGRQIPKKNWSTLIQAFSAASGEAANKWGLVLIGDGPEAPRLKELAAQSDRKVVLLPFQDQVTLCQLYGVAECLVLPSYGETWGLVVNEAMACRLPVIVSKECGCAATLVRDGSNGWQCDPHDSEQLAQMLGRFMRLSDEGKKQMGERSFEIIADWGLERFCDGIWQAMQFCTQVPAHSYALPIIDRLILNLWKGRYRPV